MNNNIYYIIYGSFIPIFVYIIMRLIDAILKRFFEKVLFSYLWNLINRKIKIFKTRFIPINTDFIFSLTHNDLTIDKSKEGIEDLFKVISEDYEDKLNTSILNWDRKKYMCGTSINYNDIKYELEIYLKVDYTKNISNINNNYVLEQKVINNNMIVNGLSFKIHTNYSYKELESRILSLVSIIQIIKNNLEKLFIVKNYSGGNIIITPLKANYQVDLWIQKKKLKTTLLLNSTDNVHVNLQKEKAEIIFKDIILFDNIIYDFIKEIVINYYI